MDDLETNRAASEVVAPRDAREAGVAKPGERHCGVCGREADAVGQPIERFGEVFCSKGHAEEFVKAVRAARVQTAAAAATAVTELAPPGAGDAAPKARDWKAYLGRALCWGAPLVALVFLLGGGGLVLGAAGALLPCLALLACPLGMYFMMRSMSKTGDRAEPGDRGGEK